jgi:hypothetical protein
MGYPIFLRGCVKRVRLENIAKLCFDFLGQDLPDFQNPGRSKHSNEIKIGSFFTARSFDTTAQRAEKAR